MTEHGDHPVHIAVPAELLRRLIELSIRAGGHDHPRDVAVIDEARALLPEGSAE